MYTYKISPLKVVDGDTIDAEIDLTKKSGLGPREKETNITKFEMGNPLGIENPVALEKLYKKTEKKIPKKNLKLFLIYPNQSNKRNYTNKK